MLHCDWCSTRIDQEPGDEFSSEELNRMGFEDGFDDEKYVVLEARHTNAVDDGYRPRRREVGQFHRPCFQRAQRLLSDHRRWAELQESGRAPRWVDGDLRSTGGTELAPSSEVRATVPPAPADAPDLIEVIKRRRNGTPVGDVVGPRTASALRGAKIVTLEELANRSKLEVLALA